VHRGVVFVYASGVIRLLAAFALVVFAPGLRAGCNDAPGPGVDWSGCTKERLVLTRASLQKGKFDRSVLSGINFGGADLSE